ncbi:M16 family metallopeptidase [Parasulfitobacter algicola]|uniref:Insulinase family protein n=1 Tax=Parasulfitobacter algicola TaxID=2614809 RepID=A0ABX2IR54_9RHOB|nr:pitrilysin family protein [Sulfitobacter algicola]NSX55005.1 insulinase family protein [Sulfitobacter algicola]
MIRALFMAAALAMATVAAKAEVEIQEVTSPGGIKAWLVQENSIPFTALEIRFKGGASLDADGKRGATNLMTALLEEGAGDMDARQFAAARDGLAASYGFDVSDDAMSVSAQFLTENRDQAIELLRTALIEPRFDDSALDRVQSQVLSIIQSDEKDPEAIVGDAFARLAFGDHPYGSSINGTLATVASLTRDDMIEAKNRVMAKDRLYVGVVGDISAEELGTLLDTLLGDLPETGANMPPRADYLLTGGVTVVPFDTPQSVARFGHQGITRDDDDFFAAFVMNVILGGGGFEARLMTEVREKRGLTYGVYSYLAPRDHAELVLGQVASANDRIAEAIEVIQAEWFKVATEGVTQDELDRAKTYLTGAYPLRFDGNGPIANIMVGMQMQDLPVDYIATRNAKVEAVTLEDVKRVAARVLQPENLHFVVVGQPAGLETTN